MVLVLPMPCTNVGNCDRATCLAQHVDNDNNNNTPNNTQITRRSKRSLKRPLKLADYETQRSFSEADADDIRGDEVTPLTVIAALAASMRETSALLSEVGIPVEVTTPSALAIQSATPSSIPSPTPSFTPSTDVSDIPLFLEETEMIVEAETSKPKANAENVAENVTSNNVVAEPGLSHKALPHHAAVPEEIPKEIRNAAIDPSMLVPATSLVVASSEDHRDAVAEVSQETVNVAVELAMFTSMLGWWGKPNRPEKY